MAPAAPMRPAPPSAAPPRAAPVYRAPPDNIAPGRFPSPPKMPADKRKAVFITPPFRPPPVLPPFAPPLHGAAPVPTYAAAAAATTTGTPAPAAPPTPKPRSPTTPCAPPPKKTRYPPLIVEKLPNWVEHFTALKRRLGHAPNARPFGKGCASRPAPTRSTGRSRPTWLNWRNTRESPGSRTPSPRSEASRWPYVGYLWTPRRRRLWRRCRTPATARSTSAPSARARDDLGVYTTPR
ncbi:uncharacterized protein LOC118281346 [Spodoptera frugiperda]|uniref:Uncharacterized protein LOC118281346 n=1 Tax=Spodoptera frugiperda TaxID=7108 RepID=A0A9R0EU24_SPOFR|nr:uncharacterized protein LOC118281346 [Spodoptera frugiperda]